MYFKQITTEGLGCLSYLIGCPASRVACVIDPKRDVQDYIKIARENGMQITHIFETHIHADHVSGNMELESRTGADVYLLKDSPVEYKFKAVDEGDVFDLGNVRLEIIKTPGHTPHSISILVTDKSRSNKPWLVLTGDCLFVGDVGRPDLAGKEQVNEQAANLYDSLYNKLGHLPDSLEVFPAHGEGSLCGKGMSAKLSSTIGFEKENNPSFNFSKEDFLKKITGSFPERPKSFTHIIDSNKKGASLLERCPITRDLSPHQVKDYLKKGAVLLDTRDNASFGGAHIPGSINIGLAKQTANWTGMVIDPLSELILAVADEKKYDDMCVELHRIGYDNILGYLYGGITSWLEAGYPVSQLWQISSAKLNAKLKGNNVKHFLDVRTSGEWNLFRIKEAKHYPLTELLNKTPDIPKDEEIIVTCAIGYRGNIAASVLQNKGFEHVHSLAGGLKAWINGGYPIAN